MSAFIKDPTEVLDYGFSWLAWLDGDTITASTWTVEAGLTKDSQSFNTTTTTVWLSGGTADVDYLATNHITTAGGRQGDRQHTIKVRDR